MTITPLTNQVQLRIEKPTAGVLDTSSKPAAMEFAEVINLGEGTQGGLLKIGDKVFVKSWAIDKIDYEGQMYYFVDIATGGIKAIVR